MVIALTGNQNCGKTTLFNRLTGQAQPVGNWPGVTVQKAQATLLPRWACGLATGAQVVDLPGVYSLAAFSQDEEITRRFLLQTPPDVLINVVDATCLERNLFLTLQLAALGLPMVLALNMLDSLAARGGRVDVALLARRLGIPVVPVCARGGQGLEQLLGSLATAAAPAPAIRCEGSAGKLIAAMAGVLPGPQPERTAMLFLEAGVPLPSGEGAQQARAMVPGLEAATGQPAAAAVAAGRYRYLSRLLAGVYRAGDAAPGAAGLDWLLMCSPFAVPLFVAVAALVFFVAFGPPGAFLTQWAAQLLAGLRTAAEGLLAAAGTGPWLTGLLLDGVWQGLAAVAAFLPPSLLLMLLLNLLEHSGYLARAAFLLDRPLRGMGLSGRSLLPLVLGFGCTVPAVLAARGIPAGRERRLAILLTPLMSCSARLPVYGLLAQAFFPEHTPLVMLSLYLLGIAAAAGMGALAARHSNSPASFVLELPPLRMPDAGNVLRSLGRRCRGFLGRTLWQVAVASGAVWALCSLTPGLQRAESMSRSLLGLLAGFLAPLLAPCGFGSPAAAAALLTGLVAKESIVGTLAVLAGPAGPETLFASPLAAFSFLLFVLFYPPCVAACAAIRQELGAPGLAGRTGAARLLLAWCLSAVVYGAGCLLGLG